MSTIYFADRILREYAIFLSTNISHTNVNFISSAME